MANISGSLWRVRYALFLFSDLHAAQGGLTHLCGFCWLQVSKLVRHLLESGSDDTKSLFSCISIHQMLLFYHGVLKDDFETHQKNFQMVKKVLGCNLVGRKMDIRALLIDRVQLQHELRVLESAFTLSVITSTAQKSYRILSGWPHPTTVKFVVELKPCSVSSIDSHLLLTKW